MPIGAGAALLGSAAIGGLGSLFGSSSAKKAAKATAAAQLEINRQQMELARELRGEGGSPVFLPLYSEDREQELFNQADLLFSNAAPGEDRSVEIAEAVSPFGDAFDAAFEDSQSGALTNRRISNTDPVRGARTKSASAKLDAVNQALDDIISQQNASESTKGFSGGGSFRNNRALQATLGARQSAADALTSAELANAQEVADIRNRGEDLAFQLAMQSPELANAALSLDRAPSTVPIEEYLDALQVFAPFNTSENSSSAAALIGGLRAPTYTPVSPTGNLLGFLSGAGSQYAGHLQSQELIDSLIQGN